jgi:hypothetical protein
MVLISFENRPNLSSIDGDASAGVAFANEPDAKQMPPTDGGSTVFVSVFEIKVAVQRVN